MPDKQKKARECYYVAAAIVVVLLLIILYMWREHAVKNTGETMYVRKNRLSGVSDSPGGPQRGYMMARAHDGHDHDAGGVSHDAFDNGHGYHTNADGEWIASCEGMMNTAHWDQAGTYQHTDMIWGLPTGEGRTNYSGFSKEGMSIGAHWDTDGTYGHTAATLPSFGLSGYFEDTPTTSWS